MNRCPSIIQVSLASPPELTSIDPLMSDRIFNEALTQPFPYRQPTVLRRLADLNYQSTAQLQPTRANDTSSPFGKVSTNCLVTIQITFIRVRLTSEQSCPTWPKCSRHYMPRFPALDLSHSPSKTHKAFNVDISLLLKSKDFDEDDRSSTTPRSVARSLTSIPASTASTVGTSTVPAPIEKHVVCQTSSLFDRSTTAITSEEAIKMVTRRRCQDHSPARRGHEMGGHQ